MNKRIKANRTLKVPDQCDVTCLFKTRSTIIVHLTKPTVIQPPFPEKKKLKSGKGEVKEKEGGKKKKKIEMIQESA